MFNKQFSPTFLPKTTPTPHHSQHKTPTIGHLKCKQHSTINYWAPQVQVAKCQQLLGSSALSVCLTLPSSMLLYPPLLSSKILLFPLPSSCLLLAAQRQQAVSRPQAVFVASKASDFVVNVS